MNKKNVSKNLFVATKTRTYTSLRCNTTLQRFFENYFVVLSFFSFFLFFPFVLLSPCPLVPLSLLPSVPLSFCPFVPLSLCLCVPVSLCPVVSLSLFHFVPLSLCLVCSVHPVRPVYPVRPGSPVSLAKNLEPFISESVTQYPVPRDTSV